MKLTYLLAMAVCLCVFSARGGDSEEGFVSIMDGKSFAGWKMSIDNTNTWKIDEGAFMAAGPTAHLFYVGDEKPFKDFELKVDVLTVTNSNGGIYFHTAYQDRGFPRAGIECQVTPPTIPKPPEVPAHHSFPSSTAARLPSWVSYASLPSSGESVKLPRPTVPDMKTFAGIR